MTECLSFSDDDNLVILTTSDGYKPTNIYINSGFVDVRKLLNNDNTIIIILYQSLSTGILCFKEVYCYSR